MISQYLSSIHQSGSQYCEYLVFLKNMACSVTVFVQFNELFPMKYIFIILETVS